MSAEQPTQQHQPVTPELRAWIIEQATAGHAPDVVLKSMLASGWNEDSAIAALEATLTNYLGEKQAERANLPAPVPVPEPLAQGARTSVWAADREVGIVMTMLKRGGQRVASLVCYLNTPTSGGQTIFPDVQLDVAPIRGNAVFFSYDRPHPVTRTLHGGAPVIAGEKWVATKWLREGRFI